jgi:predicted DNA-binding helix-hairpin-helix protein
MPSIEYDQLIRLVQLADRVSVNLEGSTQERLNALAPKKGFQREWLSMVHLAEQIRRTHQSEKPAGTVTHFVDGAVGDTDLEFLSLNYRLYRQYGLTRAYYSGFGLVIRTPFDTHLRSVIE